MHLVPLIITIGLKDKRMHAYPSFNDLPKELRGGDDWSHYVDRFGGWLYDNVAGHDDDDPESPRGVWLGMLLVPEDFANEAVARWPDQCRIADEAAAEVFYEARHTADQPEINEDLDALQTIKTRRDLGIPDDAGVTNALDPDHPAPGRRRNRMKTFEGYKRQRGITIIERLRKPQIPVRK